jgi:hypothetical protein
MDWNIEAHQDDEGSLHWQITHQLTGGYFRKGFDPIVYDVGILPYRDAECVDLCKQAITKIRDLTPLIPHQAIKESIAEFAEKDRSM